MVTTEPKIIDKTRFRFAAPAASAVRGFAGAGFADFALAANLVPQTTPAATMAMMITQTQTCRLVRVTS